MAHYFDDIFHRTVDIGKGNSGSKPGLRRSSTARSIGARSDFDASANDDDARSTAASVFQDDPDRTKEKAEADSRMHQYISDQLNRYTDDKQNGHYDRSDEFEA